MTSRVRDASPLPFTLLTGFLGSGKTTLLNALLREPELAQALVLVNELGEVSIDHLLVEHTQEELVVLPSGCVCCTLRLDLVAQLSTLRAKSLSGELPRFGRVVLETTGLADAAPIVQTLLTHPALSAWLYLDGVIATVDAQHGVETLARYRESQKQLAVADRVVITKVDLVDEPRLRAVAQAVQALNPRARIGHAKHGKIAPSFVLNVGHLDTRGLDREQTADAHVHDHASHTAVRSLAVTLERPVDFRAFSLWVAMVTQLHGDKVLRLKAVVSARGEPTPVAVQAVQHVVYPPLNLPPMPELAGRSHIVLLTHGMDEGFLRELRAELCALSA